MAFHNGSLLMLNPINMRAQIYGQREYGSSIINFHENLELFISLSLFALAVSSRLDECLRGLYGIDVRRSV